MGRTQIVRNLVVLYFWDNSKHEMKNLELPFKGRANNETLRDYIQAWHKSLECGGCNYHLSESLGFVPYVSRASVRSQISGKILAVFNAPMFMQV